MFYLLLYMAENAANKAQEILKVELNVQRVYEVRPYFGFLLRRQTEPISIIVARQNKGVGQASSM